MSAVLEPDTHPGRVFLILQGSAATSSIPFCFLLSIGGRVGEKTDTENVQEGSQKRSQSLWKPYWGSEWPVLQGFLPVGKPVLDLAGETCRWARIRVQHLGSLIMKAFE